LASNQEERPNGDVINAINSLVTVDIQTGSETVLDAAYDFYSSPALSADGSRLAWLSWRHPNMPWMATQLSAAEFDPDGGLTNKRVVAGSDAESIFQPQWSPEGRLYFISDRTDFWNLYRWNGSAVEPVLGRTAEFGVKLIIYDFSAIISMRFVSREVQHGAG
jgi:Tol biopolymer transport system component